MTGRLVARSTAMVLALGALLGGCGTGEADAPAEVEELRVEIPGQDTAGLPRHELERAREAATSLGRDLASLVFGTMEREGAVAAVRVCSEIAQERTAAHGGEGVDVRRVSDRLRNPENAPDPAEQHELARMHELDAAGRLPGEIVRLVRIGDERRLHLMRPIVVQPGCLGCHGEREEIDPEVRSILAERYPNDAAVGYSAGQLRGAISVRVPLEETR